MVPTESRPTDTVRQGEEGDRPAIGRLQALLEHPNPTLLDAALDGAGVVLVSTVADAGEVPDDAVVGYVLAIPGGETATVAELAVAPDHRREGRATALVSALFDRLRERGLTRVELVVADGARSARRFYDDLGFVVLDRQPRFYADGTAALLLERSL